MVFHLALLGMSAAVNCPLVGCPLTAEKWADLAPRYLLPGIPFCRQPEGFVAELKGIAPVEGVIGWRRGSIVTCAVLQGCLSPLMAGGVRLPAASRVVVW